MLTATMAKTTMSDDTSLAVSPETAAAFPQLAHLADLDDDQRAEAFTQTLNQLRATLDDATGR
jgi:hypothetical protein